MIVGKVASGSSETRHRLVDDEKRPCFVCLSLQFPQIAWRRYDISGSSLYTLHNDRGQVTGRIVFQLLPREIDTPS